MVAFRVSLRAHPHVVDYQDESLASCRCTADVTLFDSPTVSGDHADWLQTTSLLFPPYPTGPQFATTVCRADLAGAGTPVSWWSPPSNLTTIAATQDQIFAGVGVGDAPSSGVLELTPHWGTNPPPAPALQPNPCR
jgi:hypothetical protein